jgi:hypothetical protein
MTNIFKDGILAYVHVSYCTFEFMLTAEDLGLEKEDIADAYKLGRKLLIPSDVIRRFRAIEGRARRVLDENSFEFPISNARFITRKKFPTVLDSLKKCQGEYQSLVEKLIENYESYKTDMLSVYQQAAEIAYGRKSVKQEFGLDFDIEKDKSEFITNFLSRIDSLYPTVESLKKRFSLLWDVYEIALPRMQRANSDLVSENEKKSQIALEEYQSQIQNKISGFIDGVVSTLRQETLELCTRVISNIKDGKVIKGSTLNSISRFIEKFSELNFVGDDKIENELKKLQEEFLNTHTKDQIAEQSDLQEELKRRLSLLSESVSDITDLNSITGEYKRKIEWHG